MYGFPKDIEFESIKSPSLTYLDFFAPCFVIFSLVVYMYLSTPFVSPILIQFTPSGLFPYGKVEDSFAAL